MRLSIFTQRILCLVGFFLLTGMTLHAQNPKPFVIPELKEWVGKTGDFVPTAQTRIVCADETLLPVAQNFADDYEALFGVKLEAAVGKARNGDFRLVLKKDKKLGKEGYSIQIGKQVVVSAPETVGVYWATRTLLQMSEQSESRALPQGKITDWPDYAVRGFMMDCGRKFIPMAYLKDFAKAMAYYKMNTFQIHLNDNGFKQYFEDDWDKTYAAFRTARHITHRGIRTHIKRNYNRPRRRRQTYVTFGNLSDARRQDIYANLVGVNGAQHICNCLYTALDIRAQYNRQHQFFVFITTCK